MALPVFSIGAYSFTRFLGTMPEFPKHHFVTETRPGQDGFSLIYTGRWGEPFTIDTESVFDTMDNMKAAIAAYRNSPSLAPVNIVWADLDMSTINLQFFIQNVDIVDSHASAAFQYGNLIYQPAAVVMAKWNMLVRYIV